MAKTKPTISFIVPTHPDWAPYVRRFLVSMDKQSCQDFEVILAVDGGDDGRIAESTQVLPTWSFPLQVVDSPRPHGDFPHRNHARNAAVAASSGLYCWVVDTDFLWPEHAVEHAVSVIEAAAARGEMVAFSPVLKIIDMEPTLYLAVTDDWLAEKSMRSVEALLGTLTTSNGEWDGHGELYAPDGGPRLSPARMKEGFPCAPRAIYDALEGFDEEFLRWGGNKIEFTYRLSSLAGVGLTYAALVSVAAWHQPHPQDPNKPVDDRHRLANAQMYRRKTGAVVQGADWWLKQKAAAKRAIIAARARSEVAPEAKDTPKVPRVGLVAVADRTKGLARDVELIEQCLRGGPRHRLGLSDPAASRFTVENPVSFCSAVDMHCMEGQTWSDWLDTVDVVVIPEFLPVDAINLALGLDKRVVYIPNADWAQIHDDADLWAQVVSALAARSGFSVWAKTPAWMRVMRELGIDCDLVPWISLDPVVIDRPVPPQEGPVRFFANVGTGGYKERRNLPIILDAWRLLDAKPEEATLTIKGWGRLKPDQAGLTNGPPGNLPTLIMEDWTRQQVQASWLEHDVVLHPSKWEGFGLPLSEALNAGCPVITSDAWPMNEQVIEGHNGALIACDLAPDGFRMAPSAQVSASALAEEMRALVEDRELLRRLTAPQPGLRSAQQRAFEMFVRHKLLAEPRPRILIVRGSGDTPAGGRRSELWWADALLRIGFSVQVIAERQVPAAEPGLVEGPFDFVLIGKMGANLVHQLRRLAGADAPVVCWHMDLIDYTAQRERWQREMLQVADLCVVSEGDLDRFDEGRIVTIYPGQEIATTRPRGLPRAPDAKRAVFLGSCTGADDERARKVKRLQGAPWDLTVYGQQAGWRAAGVSAMPPSHGNDARRVYEGAMALCISRTNTRRGYTSNRLINAMAAGAVPVVEHFPGMVAITPGDGVCLLGFANPSNIAEGVDRCDSVDLRSVQLSAQERAWRHLTWEDAMLTLLDTVQPVRRATALLPASGGAFRGMWDDRIRRLGRRGVGHISWDDEKFESQTREWWKIFRRHLGRFLKPADRKVLDFGCGVGRFAGRLAEELGREVVGVDFSPSAIALAQESYKSVDFRVLNPGEPIPFPDDHFDVVFTSTVLQHIPEDEIGSVVVELRRVLRPGGVALLFEDCHLARMRKSFSGHVVFRDEREYREMFPGVNEVESFMVEGEKHAVMVGRVR